MIDEQPTLFDITEIPIVISDWEQRAKAYERRELDHLRALASVIHERQCWICSACGNRMPDVGPKVMDGVYKMRGHTKDCPYLAWRKFLEENQ